MSSMRAIPFAEIVRSAYLRRSTGVIAFDDGDDRYFFKQGELHVAADHVLADAIRGRLAQAPKARPAEDDELRRLSTSVVEPALNRASEVRFDAGTETFPGAGLVGPLTTVIVAMDVAVHDADEDELVERLGGEDARYQNSGDSPALQQLPGLEPDMVQLMAHLETPTPVKTLVKAHPGRGLNVLRALSKLRAIGLATGEAPSTSRRARRAKRRSGSRDSRVLTARALELFSERIADDLQQFPLDLAAEEHRRRLAHWLQHHASLSHYELLGIDSPCR